MDDYDARRRRGMIKIAVGLAIIVLVLIASCYIAPWYY